MLGGLSVQNNIPTFWKLCARISLFSNSLFLSALFLFFPPLPSCLFSALLVSFPPFLSQEDLKDNNPPLCQRRMHWAWLLRRLTARQGISAHMTDNNSCSLSIQQRGWKSTVSFCSLSCWLSETEHPYFLFQKMSFLSLNHFLFSFFCLLSTTSLQIKKKTDFTPPVPPQA